MPAPPSARRVLVTGASGFIGGALARLCAARGDQVHGVSRRSAPADLPVRAWWHGDLGDGAFARRLLADLKPDLVYHLASHVSGARGREAVLPTFRDNLASTVDLLLGASEAGTGRVVLAGSLEEPDGALSVPSSPYAAAKAAATAYGRMFHALYATPVVHARIFMVYGPGQRDRSKLIPMVARALLAGESPRLSSGARPVDWIYVDDVARGLLALGLAPDIEGGSYDLGSGQLCTVREVVERLGRRIAPGVPLGFGALPDRPLEVVRAAEVEATAARIGWRPEVGLDDGLARTVEWLRANP